VTEISKAAAGDVTSYAIGKKEEVERIAASAR
jgi:ribosomal protein S7